MLKGKIEQIEKKYIMCLGQLQTSYLNLQSETIGCFRILNSGMYFVTYKEKKTGESSCSRFITAVVAFSATNKLSPPYQIDLQPGFFLRLKVI
jgi:hypothetical protein